MKIKKAQPPRPPCVYCGDAAQGNFTIHESGEAAVYSFGPEVPLCDDCGKDEFPSCEEIWDKIRSDKAAQAEAEREAARGSR